MGRGQGAPAEDEGNGERRGPAGAELRWRKKYRRGYAQIWLSLLSQTEAQRWRLSLI